MTVLPWMLPNQPSARSSPCRATVMVPSGQRPPLSTWPLVITSTKNVGFRGSGAREFARAIEIGILRLRASGIDGELDFLRRLAPNLAQFARPIAVDACGGSGRRRFLLGLGRAGKRRLVVGGRRKLRRCRRNRGGRSDNESEGAVANFVGHVLVPLQYS